jgi:hypothetical protein
LAQIPGQPCEFQVLSGTAGVGSDLRTSLSTQSEVRRTPRARSRRARPPATVGETAPLRQGGSRGSAGTQNTPYTWHGGAHCIRKRPGVQVSRLEPCTSYMFLPGEPPGPAWATRRSAWPRAGLSSSTHLHGPRMCPKTSYDHSVVIEHVHMNIGSSALYNDRLARRASSARGRGAAGARASWRQAPARGLRT